MADRSQPLIGSSEVFRIFSERLAQAAASDATVLLHGESGTGKGAAARELHRASPRAEGPFVVVDLAALPPGTVESELFGHERGAFTDAHRDRPGFFRRAEGGTILLDDVDLLPLQIQAKLLRVLQEREVEPVGGDRPVPVDARVVATTHRDLLSEVEAKRFREDLYYRLAVVPIEVPPLRARPEDLPGLAEALIARCAERLGVESRILRPEALERLSAHPWPGNVRELENALERVLVLRPDCASGNGAEPPERSEPPEPPEPIGADELGFLAESTDGRGDELAREVLAHGISVDDMALAMMRRAVEEQRGNLSAAARRLGITRRALEYRLERADESGRVEAGEETRS